MKNNLSRRDFLRNSVVAGTGLLVTPSLWALQDLANKGEFTKLTILYTNDWHSRIEPWPASDPKNPNLGGAARRSTFIKNVRAKEKNVLLLDAGDIFQGTPYFNFYGGELEYKLMSAMEYDASTIGNHDFDNGLEGLLKQLPLASFDMINANYDFSDTVLAKHSKIKPYKVFVKDGVKIGIFGVGVELEGLVSKAGYANTKYLDPLEKAAELSYFLKNELKCDYVICLSHLGYSYKDKKISDRVLAEESKNINLIIGGHTHTYLEKPTIMRNRDKKEIWVTQMGWAGLHMGRIDLFFSKKDNKIVGSESAALLVDDELHSKA